MDTKIDITYYVPKVAYATIDLNKLYSYIVEKVKKVDDPAEYKNHLINYFDENFAECLYFSGFYDIYDLDVIDDTGIEDIVDEIMEKLEDYIKEVLNVE